MEKIYDVLILGGGVAGMSASIYAKRAGKSVAIVEKFSLGGQVLQLDKIENFPSQALIDGISLSQMFSKQVKTLGVEILRDEIVSVDFVNDIKKVFCKKDTLFAKNVIIATGIQSRKLGVGEDKFLGRGVSYCAVCDANFYKNKKVCVASKAGSGIKDALYLTGIASEVLLIDSEDISKYASVNKNEKLKIVYNCHINAVDLVDNVVEIVCDDVKFEASALFVELGKIPATEIFEGVLQLDEKGFIITNEKMQTSVDGVFAVGDVRNGVLKQIVTAASDGAIAGQNAI